MPARIGARTRSKRALYVPGRTVAAIVPSAIAGGKFWVKSDAGLFQDSGKSVPVTASLDPLGAWIEQFGSGATFDVIQATAGARPTYSTALGIPWITFNGTQRLSTSGSVVHGISSAFTFFVAFYVTAIDTYHALLALANGNRCLFANRERMDLYMAADHNFDNRLIGANSVTIATVYRESGSDKCRINGIPNALTPADATNFASGVINIGTDTAAGDLGFDHVGAIGEIIAYPSLLTVAQMQGIERYLANRFPVALPF